MAKKKELPSELEGVAYSEDVNAIQERVERCYSKDRYEEFQEAVEKITWKYFKGVIGFAVFLWLASLIGSMLLQKFFRILG